MFGNVPTVFLNNYKIRTPSLRQGGWLKQYRAALAIAKSIETISIKPLEVQDVSASPRF
jgi:hypothetical protein